VVDSSHYVGPPCAAISNTCIRDLFRLNRFVTIGVGKSKFEVMDMQVCGDRVFGHTGGGTEAWN
jgi:hypothetical protein